MSEETGPAPLGVSRMYLQTRREAASRPWFAQPINLRICYRERLIFNGRAFFGSSSGAVNRGALAAGEAPCPASASLPHGALGEGSRGSTVAAVEPHRCTEDLGPACVRGHPTGEQPNPP